jgi:pimeloyl-ACP methyl ester carboxylesterase
MSTRPELLLVHGAWHGPGAWDTLLPELSGEVRTVRLPSSGPDPTALGDFADDVRAVRDAVAAGGDRPTVVVAHSYGGLPTTEAVCGMPNVVGVIYLAAFVVDGGHAVADLFAGGPPPWWDLHADQGYVDVRDPEAVFYGDVSAELATASSARLVHQSLSALGATLADAAWRHVPTTYIVCDKDAAIPPALQEVMARNAVRVHHLPSSHSPFLSIPGALAALIERETEEFTR